MIPIDALIRSFTPDEAFELAMTTFESLKVPSRSWRTWGVAYSMTAVFAQVGSMASKIIAPALASVFLEDAFDDWLTILAWRTYRVERIAAAPATGQITLTNTGGGTFTRAADTVFVRSTRTGQRYRVSQGFTLAPLGQVTVDAIAVVAGSGGSAAPGEIDDFETPLARVTVSNAASFVGADAELDDTLKSRCLGRLATLSANGPRDAYVSAVLDARVPSGAQVSISRVATRPPDGRTLVRLVCATPSGAPTLEELAAARTNIEKLARTDTDTVQLSAAVTVPVSRTLTIWSRKGDVDLIKERAYANLALLASTCPIGGDAKSPGGQGYLYADAIKAAAKAADPTIFDVDSDTDSDVILAYNHVPQITASIEVRSL